MRVRSYKWSKGKAEFECELDPYDSGKSVGDLVRECKDASPLKRVPYEDLLVSTFGVDGILFVTIERPS